MNEIKLHVSNEMTKQWLLEMLEMEIHEMEDTIENEELWALGADCDEVEMHISNMDIQHDYLEMLQQAYNDLNEIEPDDDYPEWY